MIWLSPVFTEEDGGHHGEAGGQEGEASEYCGYCGEDGDGHNLPEAAATLAVKIRGVMEFEFWKHIFWDTDLPIHQEYRPNLPAISP